MNPQQIQLEPLPDHACVGDSFPVRAKATSGLAVQASVVAGPATVVNNQVTCLRPGEVKIKLAQDGNAEFEPAPELVLTLNVSKARQTIEVEPLPAEVFSGDRITIKANASSRLPVDLRILSGPAQVSGGRIAIITGPGPVEIEAHQSGSDKYLPIKTALSFTALQRPQEIRFAELDDRRFGQSGFAFRATCTSGLPVTVELLSGPGRVRDNDVFLAGGGPVVVKAIQTGDRCYAAAEVVHTFTPPKKRQSIDFETGSGTIRINETFTLKVAASSNLPVSLSVASGTARLEDDRLTPTVAGALVIKAYQPGNEAYEPAQAEQTFSVAKARQTLAFKRLPNEVFVGETVNLEAVASSELTSIIFSVVSGRAEITGRQLTATGAGTVVLKAIQSGDERFEAAQAETSFIVLKAKQLISFDTLSREASVGESLLVGASANSGLPVCLEVVSGPAKLVDCRLSLHGAGEVKIKASQPGDERYAPAPEAFAVIRSLKAQQAIRFDLAREQLEVGDSIVLNAEASSGQPVRFRVLSGRAELRGNSLVGMGAGPVEIEAEQTGTDRYLGAKTQRSLLVHKRAQQIHCDPIPDKRFGEGPFVISATATSGLPVTFKVVSGPARITNNQVTLLGSGQVEIDAHQSGNDTFEAKEGSLRFHVAKASQSIIFAPPPPVVRIGETFLVQAEASSGLPVNLEVAQGSGTFEANRLSAESAGPLTIRATQPGNDDFESTQAEQSFSVLKSLQTLEFKNLPRELPIGVTCALEAVATSGLAVNEFAVSSGAASISGNQLIATAAGRVVIKAVQKGDERFEPAEAEQSLSVVRNQQTLRFELAREELQLGESLSLAAAAASGQPVIFRVLSGPVELTDNTLVATGIGVAEIEAEQLGTDKYLPVKSQCSVRITRRSQHIELAAPADLKMGGGPFVLKAVASSGLPVAYSVASGPARINHNELTVLGAGQVSIKVMQPGNDTYLPAEQVFSFSVAKGNQTIRFDVALAAIRVGEALLLEATANSGLPVRFTILEGKGQLVDNRLSPSAAGNLNIKALQPGNENFEPAEVVRSLTVLKAAQTLQFKNLPARLHVGERCRLEAVASSGLEPDFSVVSGAAVISGHDLLANGAGLLVLKAAQPGNNAFESAESTQSFEILKTEQSIDFDGVPDQACAGETIPIAAKASSGLPVTIEVVSGPAEIVDARLRVHGAGEVKLKATQLGDANYCAAPQLIHTLTAIRARQTLRFDFPSHEIQVGDSIPLRAEATSGHPVVFRVVSGAAELRDNVLLTVGAGPVQLEAEQAGNSQFEPARLRRSLSVLKRSQTIQIDPLPDRQFGEPSFIVRAMASSGLPVSIAVASGPARMDGEQLTLLGAGRVEIRASQNGTERYAAAEALGNFSVAKGRQTIDFEPVQSLTVGEDRPLRARASSGQPVSFRLKVGRAKLEGNRLNAEAAGTLVVEAVAPGSDNYEPAQALQTLDVARAKQTLRFKPLPAEVTVGESCSLETVASSGLLNVTFELVSGHAKITGTQLRTTGAGPVIIKALQSGNEFFEPAEAEHSILVIKAKQSIQLDLPQEELQVGDSIALQGQASSGQPVTFRVLSGPGQLNGETLVATNSGTVEIEAEQTGDEKYLSVKTKRVLRVIRRSQHIEFSELVDSQLGDPGCVFSSAATSGLPVSLAIISGQGRIADDKLILTGTGAVVVKAVQQGDARYAFTEAVRSFAPPKRRQRLEFDSLPTAVRVGQTVSLRANASSGAPVGFCVISGQAAVVGDQLTPETAGTLRLRANVVGNEDFEPAEAELSLTVGKATQTLAFKRLPQELCVGDSCQLEAVASSGLNNISFSVANGAAQITGDQLRVTAAGPLVIKAVQPGDARFEAAAAEQSVLVAKAKQTIQFADLPREITAGQSLLIQASASSQLPVQVELISGPAEILDLQLTVHGPGEVKLKATQPGDDNFAPAPAVVQTVLGVKAPQSIRFALGLLEVRVGDPVPLAASASSGLPVTFRIVSGPAQLNGSVLVAIGAGQIEIEAEQAGNDTYLPAKQRYSVRAAKRSQEIVFDALGLQKVDGPPVPLRANASSGLPVSFTVISGPARVNGNVLTLLGTGRAEIKAKQDGNDSYSPAEAVSTLTIGKASQTIRFDPISGPLTAGQAFTVRAIASSGLPVSFQIVDGEATLNGTCLTPTVAGQLTIKAVQTGSEAYEPAEALQQLLVVKAKQTLRFAGLPKELSIGDTCALNGVASSGLSTFRFAIVSGRASVSGNELRATGAGPVLIKAIQSGDETFEAAEVENSITIVKSKQTIRFDELPAEVVAGELLPLRASSDSGLAVKVEVLSGPATIEADRLRLQGAGLVKIRATQAGDENYAPAPEIVQTVTVSKARQTIRFDLAGNELQIGESILLAGTASSGQPVTFRLISGPAELAGDSLVGTGAGTVEIEAEVPANNQYLPATARRSFRVIKRSQQINLEPLRNRKLSESPFVVGAKATSGLPVAIAIVSGPASINGDEVTLRGGGKVRLLVTQPGDDRYESAPDLEAEFDAKQPRKLAPILIVGALFLAAVLVTIVVLLLPKNRSASSSVTQTLQNPPEPAVPVVKSPTQAELAYAEDLSNSIALFHDGKLELARQLIDKVLQEGPANTAAIGLKADIEEAIRINDLQRDLQSAQQAESQAQWTNAIALLEQTLLKANSVKDPKYRQPVATELSYATNILGAQTAVAQARYADALHQADAALVAKNNDPVAGKLKADAQLGKDYVDALGAGRTALSTGNFSDALKQATAALHIRNNDPEAISLQKLALQEQAYQLAASAFRQGDYATALNVAQPFQGTNRFDVLTKQISQEQNQLKTMQTALTQGNYSAILQSSLPDRPAFNTIKTSAAAENDALKQARQKLIAHDFGSFDALQGQTYATKPPFVAVIKEARQAQDDAKAAEKTNVVVAAPPNTSATSLSVAQQDKLVDYWEIYFGVKPRPPGSDVKPVRDPTKDSAYNLEQFDKVQADYVSAGAFTADRKRRLNVLRWIVSAGKQGEAPGFQK